MHFIKNLVRSFLYSLCFSAVGDECRAGAKRTRCRSRGPSRSGGTGAASAGTDRNFGGTHVFRTPGALRTRVVHAEGWKRVLRPRPGARPSQGGERRRWAEPAERQPITARPGPRPPIGAAAGRRAIDSREGALEWKGRQRARPGNPIWPAARLREAPRGLRARGPFEGAPCRGRVAPNPLLLQAPDHYCVHETIYVYCAG